MVYLIPYILAVMIIYDFSLHVFDLLLHAKLTTHKHPLGIYLVLNYFAGNDAQKRKTIYNIFWTTYWGLASTLIIVYIMYQ
jgi:hypothetical protein